MYKVKVIALSIVLILFSFVAQAKESEGLIQKTYKKFVLKEKSVEKKPALKPENTSTTREGAKIMVDDKAYKDMSKAEMIQEIKDEVDSEEDILEYIPELKRQKDKDGKDIYSYLVEGKQVNLEGVDEETLRAILEQIGAKAKQIGIDTIQEQQDQREQLNAIRRPVSSPSLPTRPPTVPRPPKK